MSMIVTHVTITPQNLQKILDAPEILRSYLDIQMDYGQYLYIDKAWHGLHFLLTGTTWGGEPPLVNVILGGTIISEEEIGYGPARYITTQEVKEVSEALDVLTFEQIWKNFDPEIFNANQIYPEAPNWEDSDGTKGYLHCYFNKTTNYFRVAKENGAAMIITIT